MSIVYHVFTDNKDHYCDTLKEAREILKKWKKEGIVRWRVYKLFDAEKEDTEREEYLCGYGSYPI